ncbi:hypothetical protein K437DRAFT_270923 [Tilletiaria anomala UBC 951]|uniref:Snurportin-1 n=1 Tax=Tilletiaria anomala (strain ATCC 24038 / CBS 436.72 / UBC 951) TaxID=1037660 RepID=A0A066V6Z3_TILAU|nr:uncharacterized protein K437DRAFT_270923 [Tilletiaria anomala UBC 951]KDN37241.1 hypothetical protein K437DRAFT_270923 [Tilletiaria anomala UBC 951]
MTSNHDRLSFFKRGPPANHTQSQVKRREAALAHQEQRRRFSVQRARNEIDAGDAQASLLANSDLSEHAESPGAATRLSIAPLSSLPSLSHRGHTSVREAASRPYADRLMHAELVNPDEGLPFDVGTEWCAVGPLPKGKRCLAVVNPSRAPGKATMTLYSRVGGKPIAIYPSHGPSQVAATLARRDATGKDEDMEEDTGGEQDNGSTSRDRRIRFPAPEGVPPGTQLDCILLAHHSAPAGGTDPSPYEDRGTGMLYVLDLLCWGTRSFEDCDTEFRLYWRNARLRELPAYHVPREARLSPTSSSSLEQARAHWSVERAPYPFVLVPLPSAAAPLAKHADIWFALQEAGAQQKQMRIFLRRAAAPALIEAGTHSAVGASHTAEEMLCEGKRELEAEVAVRAQPSRAVLIAWEADDAADQSKGVQGDGLLLYHRQACYERGSTPLALWLPPEM